MITIGDFLSPFSRQSGLFSKKESNSVRGIRFVNCLVGLHTDRSRRACLAKISGASPPLA